MTDRADDAIGFLALQHFVEDCRAMGHDLCGRVSGGGPALEGPRCQQVLLRAAAREEALAQAARFDVKQELLEQRDAQPDSGWPVAALLRYVHDQLVQGPWSHPNPFKRGVWVTSALARLGELGLPADVVVRTGVRDELRRRIALLIVAARCANGVAGESRRVAPVLAPWVEALAACPDQEVESGTELGASVPVLVARALRGDFAPALDRWLSEASIKDVIGWDWEMTKRQEVHDTDLMLRGGDDAARWVCDRFVHTEMSRWRRCSLEWELRYTHEPEATAADAGVAVSLLEQRPMHVQAVTDELVRRLACPGDSDPIVAGLTRVQLLDQVILLIHDGRLDVVVTLVREAVRCHPEDVQLRNMLAFCLIPTAPQEALQHLERLSPGRELSVELIAANTAAARLRAGDRQSAKTLVDDLVDLDTHDCEDKPLLWPASQVVDLDAVPSRLEQVTIRDWARELRESLAAKAPVR